MKALLLTSEFPPGPGGIATHAYELARGLTIRGWSIRVATRQSYATPEEVARFNRALDFEVVELPRARSRRPGAARDELARSRPQVVVASGAAPLWLAAGAGGSAKRVAVVHGSELTAGAWMRRTLTRRSLATMDGIVCVSHHTREVLRGLGVTGGRQAVIPNGADPERFHPYDDARVAEVRARLSPGTGPEGRQGPSEGPFLLTVGHVSHRKAQDVVIRALPAIARRHPRVVYLIAGLPSLRDAYRKLAESLGVGDHVRFLGRVDADELAPLYAACDLFVLTSRNQGGDFEGYGIAAVEAALAGRAIVASEGSGLSEAVRDGETGLLVPPDDPQATATAILGLLDDPRLAQRLGREARRRALDQQTWSKRIDAYDAFLREVAAS